MRLGEAFSERGISRLGREEEVGVDMAGARRPLTDESRGLAIVDISGIDTLKGLQVARYEHGKYQMICPVTEVSDNDDSCTA